jgi:Ca-activated chloride channel family protein
MRAALGLLFVCLTAAVLAAQEPAQAPTFRATTRLVPLPTMVTDGEGRLVPELTQEDFTILDDGKPQEIVLFENTVQPLRVVILLDSSISTTAVFDRIKQAAEAFILRLLPEDEAQVGAFSSKIQLSGSFTNNRDALIGALDELQYGNETRMRDAIDAAVTELEGEDERRVILLLTDGEDFGSKNGIRAVRERAQRENVMVYGVGLRLMFAGTMSNPDGDLRKLAEATGGGYFVLKDTAELNATFTRVAQELHSLYSIGFVPQTLDGKEHKIQVRMKEPGQKARTRTTYIAAVQD